MAHRGKQGSDDKLFTQKWQAVLCEATQDLSFLLNRGYGIKSATALVGNRYKLNVRQQRALTLAACPLASVATRCSKVHNHADMQGAHVFIDGFNVLITIEALLSQGFLIHCQDGCFRDLASIHGSYKKVVETEAALHVIDTALKKLNIAHAMWYFDKPVCNAGMLKTHLYNYKAQHNCPWDVELVADPDKTLVALQKEKSKTVVISADAWILDNITSYFNLTKYIIEHRHSFHELKGIDLQIIDMFQ